MFLQLPNIERLFLELLDKIGLNPDYTIVDDNADDDYDVQYYEAMNIINRALAD